MDHRAGGRRQEGRDRRDPPARPPRVPRREVGGDGEHADETGFVTDKDTSTTWSTESYSAGLQKEGVGIHVDASPGLAAREIEVVTTTPGFTAEIYGATSAEPPAALDGWTRLAPARQFGSDERVRLPGRRHRYFLVWITELAADDKKAEIAEIRLRAPR